MARKNIKTKFNNWLDSIESRWSLWMLIKGSGLMAAFGLPAWAVNTANIFSQYSPASWVGAGFLGLSIAAIIYCIFCFSYKIYIKAKYDESLLERTRITNPLDLTFEGERIFLNDFVLPSNPIIQGKTFINCDIIGPACLYFPSGNLASEIRLPIIDGVWLEPSKHFNSGIILNNCIFRGCSFQRITIFASVENYHDWKDNANINWISIPPTDEHIAKRKENLIPSPKNEIAEAPKNSKNGNSKNGKNNS